MSFDGLMVDVVSIVHPGTTVDRYGNTVVDWVSARSTATKAWISQRSAEELSDAGRSGEVSEWVGFFPLGTELVAADHVEWDGDVFEVVGKPNPAKTPRGAHHVECQLRLVTG